MLIREKANKLLSAKSWKYLVVVFAGFALAFLELTLLFNSGVLLYTSHMIGFGVSAAGLCCLALSFPNADNSFTAHYGRRCARRIYFICHIVAYGILYLSSLAGEYAYASVYRYVGVIVYLVSLLIVALPWIVKAVYILIKTIQENDEDNTDIYDTDNQE